jgi:hypothetical protein
MHFAYRCRFLYCSVQMGGGRLAVRSKYTSYPPPHLIGANPFQGQLEWVGPENREFFGPEMARGWT